MSTATTGSNPITMNDVESCLSCCADAFAQLAALLHVIKNKAPEHSDAGKLQPWAGRPPATWRTSLARSWSGCRKAG